MEPAITALLLVTLLVSASPQANGQSPTLAESLRAANVPLPRDTKGTELIFSFGSLNDGRWFVIAYYDETSDGRVNALRIRAFDKQRRLWHFTTHDEIGSILSIRRSGGLFYVEGHASPSATPSLVLTERLSVKKELDGWPMLFLPDGRLVFNRSMIHFAPTHAEVLAIYDPSTNRERTLYPQHVDNYRGGEQAPGTDLWVDRFFGDVTRGSGSDTVVFVATSQVMRLTENQRPEPAGPQVRRRVTCTLTASAPICHETGIVSQAAERDPR